LRAPPPPLFALLPAVFRPVCFRELLVVAKGSPFQDYSSATPRSATDNRCKGSAAGEVGRHHPLTADLARHPEVSPAPIG
jgi:hypothetical protein